MGAKNCSLTLHYIILCMNIIDHFLSHNLTQAVLPLFALTAIGWLLVVIGFGMFTEPGGDVNHPVLYPMWMVSFCGPVVIGCGVACCPVAEACNHHSRSNCILKESIKNLPTHIASYMTIIIILDIRPL